MVTCNKNFVDSIFGPSRQEDFESSLPDRSLCALSFLFVVIFLLPVFSVILLNAAMLAGIILAVTIGALFELPYQLENLPEIVSEGPRVELLSAVLAYVLVSRFLYFSDNKMVLGTVESSKRKKLHAFLALLTFLVVFSLLGNLLFSSFSPDKEYSCVSGLFNSWEEMGTLLSKAVFEGIVLFALYRLLRIRCPQSLAIFLSAAMYLGISLKIVHLLLAVPLILQTALICWFIERYNSPSSGILAFVILRFLICPLSTMLYC